MSVFPIAQDFDVDEAIDKYLAHYTWVQKRRRIVKGLVTGLWIGSLLALYFCILILLGLL